MAAVLVLAACSNPSGGDDHSVDTDLVGKWYTTQENADADGAEYYDGLRFTFNANGTCVNALQPDEARTFTTSGGKLTIRTSSREDGTANYSINGTVLTLTNAEHGLDGFGSTLYKKQ